MKCLNGAIGFGLILLALLHLGVPARPHALIGMYCFGALLAFITLARRVAHWPARILAVCATGCMLFFFAGFFQMAPSLGDEWYAVHLSSLGQLIAAFAMLPVLSGYSCLMKADCAEARKSRGFFSVPERLRFQNANKSMPRADESVAAGRKG
ncbi:MAG: hypothetical protein OXE83_12560 [Gammaproteobacteria bacterium]|nr:hypothetical protein [Gammaproteobacteria bacterium]